MPTLHEVVTQVQLAPQEESIEAERIGRSWASQTGQLADWDRAFESFRDADPQKAVIKRLLTQIGIVSNQFGFGLIPLGGIVAPRVFVLRFGLLPMTKVQRVISGFIDVAARVEGIVVDPPPIVRVIQGGIEILAARREWDICNLSSYIAPGHNWKPWDKLLLPLGVSVEGSLIKDESIHMLIAGTTGGGKTATLNALLGGVIQMYSQKQVQWLLIDPEQVGLARFKGLGWFWGGVKGDLPTHALTDRLQSVEAFQSVLDEHECRLRILAASGVDSIERYNRANVDSPMPHLLVVVDEFAVFRGFGAEVVRKGESDDSKRSAETIAKEGNSLIDSIAIEISQRCRKTGIHLILATQRAAANVLVPELRDNLGTRIILRCVSRGGSQVAFGHDCDWACSLMGNGDMWIVLPTGIQRAQGLYIDDDRILSDGKTRFDRLIEAAKQYKG